MIKTYYLLTKPGIIFGNLITAVAGVALASKGEINWLLFLQTLIGLGCVIGSACVFNNYIDRDLDKKMSRTKQRALVQGLITGKSAIRFALLLGLIGFVILGLYTNRLTVLLSALGFFIYVALYSFWKSKTSYATLVGSISGALPPVIGYCAVTNRFDVGALLLFLILVLWQMPHFFAIAMYRFNDYSAASIPVLPVQRGNQVAKVHMFLYILAFTLSAIGLVVFGYTGKSYLIVATLSGFTWGWLCLKGFQAESDEKWARQMFVLSLVIIMALSLMMSLDVVQGGVTIAAF